MLGQPHERQQRASFPPLRVRLDPVRMRSRSSRRDGQRPLRAMRPRHPVSEDALGLDDEGAAVEAQARARKRGVRARAPPEIPQAESRRELIESPTAFSPMPSASRKRAATRGAS